VEHEIWERIAANEPRIAKRSYFRILSRRIRRFESASVNRYDLLVPITARDLDRYQEMGNTRPSFVCPAALDLDEMNEIRAPHGLPDLFFLGSLEWKPNQEGLLWFTGHVFPAILARHPGIHLHIAGRNAPGWLRKRCTARNVVFHGEVPDASLFIGDHDIMVAPCFSGGGMRVKIVEAMAHGKPVVTTPVGAEGLGATHRDHILICATEDEFVESLDSLVKFPDFYRKIGQNARDFAKDHFDNMKVTAGLIRFYTSNLT
jgi:glycosyltransferase involved in cell wall biosynthesis